MFSAVLLAGGESRRMGKDKATVVFHLKPLWQRQLQVLHELRPAKIFISARSAPSWLPLEAELLLDEPPSRGPLSGLTIALQRMQTSHLVALAIDMPFMTSEQLRLLCSLALSSRGVVPVIDERAEPLAAIYPQEALADFAAALAGRDFSLQTLTRNLAHAGKVQMVGVADADRDLYRNINAPSDLLRTDTQE
jgi:molybdopterin-guanine dinucleotide biosynthesis protein A